MQATSYFKEVERNKNLEEISDGLVFDVLSGVGLRVEQNTEPLADRSA